MPRTWYVYILQCADASLYTGIAVDVSKRLAQHNGAQAGGPKYTRGRRPVRLLWFEEVADHGAALRREAAIKKLPQRDKLKIAGLEGHVVVVTDVVEAAP